jgi:hypothetical protein
MKFTTTFLAFFAAVVASTFLSQVNARVGGDRELNSNDIYTVYFANSYKSEVGVTARGHSEVMSPNNCHGVFPLVATFIWKYITGTDRRCTFLSRDASF